MMDYDQIKAMNFSTLKNMADGPNHYLYRLQHKRKQTEAMAFGVAVHVAVLEPEQFPERYAICDLHRNSNAFKEQAALEAEAGRIIIKGAEHDKIRTMADSVRANPAAAELLTHCTTEGALTWQRPDGRQCKGRLDAYRLEPVPVLVDYKTTVDPRPWKFQRQVAQMHYHAQMAWYAEGMVEALSCAFPEVFIIATGNTPPYETIVYRVPVSVLAQGEELYLRWLEQLDECERTGKYPGPYEGMNELELPAWAATEADEETSLIIGGEEYTL